MGYYMTLVDSDVSWKPDVDRRHVLQQIKTAMFSPRGIKTHAVGGSYAWVDMARCQNAEDIDEILDEFFDAFKEVNGQWHVAFETKMGDEQVLMEHLAPFITSGSYMEWRGSDDEYYRWDFDGTTLTERTGRVRITWE